MTLMRVVFKLDMLDKAFDEYLCVFKLVVIPIAYGKRFWFGYIFEPPR
jgi:hypothetical protein